MLIKIQTAWIESDGIRCIAIENQSNNLVIDYHDGPAIEFTAESGFDWLPIIDRIANTANLCKAYPKKVPVC